MTKATAAMATEDAATTTAVTMSVTEGVEVETRKPRPHQQQLQQRRTSSVSTILPRRQRQRLLLHRAAGAPSSLPLRLSLLLREAGATFHQRLRLLVVVTCSLMAADSSRLHLKCTSNSSNRWVASRVATRRHRRLLRQCLVVS